jgi:hypothetical protein
MSVRKRVWRNGDGSQGEAWVVNYTDRGGVRRLKSFDRKRDAEAFEVAVGVGVRSGIHVSDSQSVMIIEAARLWLATCESAGRRPAHRPADRRRETLATLCPHGARI